MTDTSDNFDWSAAEQQLSDTRDVDDDLNVQKLGDLALLDKFQEITDQLRERNEMLLVKTQEGRELQSQRGAIRIELARRGLM